MPSRHVEGSLIGALSKIYVGHFSLAATKLKSTNEAYEVPAHCRLFVRFRDSGRLSIFVLAIVSVLMYLIVTPLEERELRQQYRSEYEAYCLAAPRFILRLRPRKV